MTRNGSAHLIPSVHSRLCSLHWKSGSIHDPKGVIPDLAVHDAHDLINPTGACVRHLEPLRTGSEDDIGTYHLDQSDSRDLDDLEVVGTALLQLGKDKDDFTDSSFHGA